MVKFTCRANLSHGDFDSSLVQTNNPGQVWESCCVSKKNIVLPSGSVTELWYQNLKKNMGKCTKSCSDWVFY